MKFIIAPLMLILTFTLSCTRAVKPVSKLSIRLPKVLGSSQSPKQSVQAAGSGSPWSGQITASSEVNCYVVMVGGPEPDLNRNVCKETSTAKELVRFGIYEGGVAAGQDISLNVPSGTARRVSLVALQAQAGACVTFHGSGPQQGKLSHPRVIETRTVDLSPGSQSLDFSVPANLAALPEIDECDVQDIPAPGGGGGGGGGRSAFWGDGRDGSLNIGTTSSFYIDAGMDHYDDFTTGAHTPAVGGVASTKTFLFQDRIVHISSTDGAKFQIYSGVPTPQNLEAGDMVFWWIANGWSSTNPDSNSCGGGLARGMWGMEKVTAIDSITGEITLEHPISMTPASVNNTNLANTSADESTPHCSMMMTRVSQFENVTLVAGSTLNLTNSGWTSATLKAGVMVVWIKNLVLGSGASLNISMNGNGHTSGSAGAYGLGGGGNTAANYENRPGISGGNGAGGGNGGAGGNASGATGGAAINHCLGTACLPFIDKKAFFGAGGAGNGSYSGGNGGGLIIFAAENISGSGSVSLTANGANSGYTSAGGGAGGTIAFYNKSMDASVSVTLAAVGGNAGAGAGGGGGGVIERATCSTQSLGTVSTVAGAGSGNSPGAGFTQANDLGVIKPAYCQ